MASAVRSVFADPKTSNGFSGRLAGPSPSGAIMEDLGNGEDTEVVESFGPGQRG